MRAFTCSVLLLATLSGVAHGVSRHVDLRVTPIKKGGVVTGARIRMSLIVEGDGKQSFPNIDDVRVSLGSLDVARWRKAGASHGPSGASMKRGYLLHQWQVGPLPKWSTTPVDLELDYASTGLRSGQEVDVISAFLQRGSDLSAGFHTYGMALPMRDRSSVRTLP